MSCEIFLNKLIFNSKTILLLRNLISRLLIVSSETCPWSFSSETSPLKPTKYTLLKNPINGHFNWNPTVLEKWRATHTNTTPISIQHIIVCVYFSQQTILRVKRPFVSLKWIIQ